MHDADSLLVSFLRSTEESERERLLSDLILVYATPLIRHTIWRRLGWYLKSTGDRPSSSSSPGAADAEDMQNEIATNLIQRLRTIQQDGSASPIENFRQYTVRIAENCCHNHLRAKSQARYHLKDTLRNLLSRRREFKTWKADGMKVLCGLSAWQGQLPTDRSSFSTETITSQLRMEAAGNPALQRKRLAGLVARVFELSAQPIELDDLTEIIAGVLSISDPAPESIEQNDFLAQSLPSDEISAEERLEEVETLRKFWSVILRLPEKQRLAFCLNFSNQNGEDLLSLLLDARAVTPSEFAQGLNISEDRMWQFLDAMPMKNAAVAAHLGVKVEEVGKWLYLARKELRKELLEILRGK